MRQCGMPCFVGGLIVEEDDLSLQTPKQPFDRIRLDVRINEEVVATDRDVANGLLDGMVLRMGHARASLSTKSAQPNQDSSESLRILRRSQSASSLR